MKTNFLQFFLFFCFFGYSQTESIKVESFEKLAVNADVFVGYDKFEFLYFIKDNALFKVKDNESFEYKNLALGQITKVDLLNPLKVIVFYERFNTVVTLDNQLNETLKINFSKNKNPLVVTKIGVASQNQLWVFDEISSQLYLYDTGSGALKSVATPISEPIIYYNSDFNSFEWLDKKNDWYQCSVFGKVEKLNYQSDLDSILFTNSEFVFYKKEESIFVYNRKTKVISEIENSEKSFTSITFKNQILSIFTNQGISNYKITIP